MTPKDHDDQDDCNLEMAIKTISFRQCTALLLHFAGLPNEPKDVDGLVYYLSTRNKIKWRRRPASDKRVTTFQVYLTE